MLSYSVIMFLAAALFSALGTAVYRGRTDLIHSCHQTRMRDRAAYGRAFGKALFCFAAAMCLSGLVGLFAKTRPAAVAAVAILLAGLCVGIARIVAAQIKYNGGIF